jgi:uncharacterized membrane protein
MSSEHSAKSSLSFRARFFRGLGILLPTVLTIWILVAVYQFVDARIAAPINRGVRTLVLQATPWPTVADGDVDKYLSEMQRTDRRAGKLSMTEAVQIARKARLHEWWRSWPILDLIGLVVAIILIYMAGLILGSYIGRRLYARGEELLGRVPIFKAVYPYVKQVTDFFVGEKDKKLQFSNVVAVEYPRKGLWSLGLVTGDTMRTIQNKAGQNCVTVFVPSSPTPFTGYVVTVPVTDTIDLDITIDDALRFTVSGGVIVPTNQLITHRGPSGPSEATGEPGTPADSGGSGDVANEREKL